MPYDDAILLPNRAGDEARRFNRMRERVDMAEAECERLRGLLATAREAIRAAQLRFREAAQPHRGMVLEMDEALRRSEPDASPEDRP